MAWHRVRADDKLAFREDLQSDTTLTDLQKRMISTIATRWDNSVMHSECSLSYIAAGAGTTKKMAHKYAPTLTASGRVTIKRSATYTESTLWDVNWWYRGSAWVRTNNAGNPIFDCRKESPSDASGNAGGLSPSDAQVASLGVPRPGDQFPSKDGIGAPGARPFGDVHGAPRKEKKENPHRAQPGFAKWKIVHAEYSGEDEDMFVAHLRSGASRKFVLRCHVDSAAYASLDAALLIDGEAERAVHQLVQMSTSKKGEKTFLRAAPLPWVDVTVLSGEDNEDGASIRVRFDDDGSQSNLALSREDAARLTSVCGGEETVAGSRVRYRLMPDDSLEFRADLQGGAMCMEE